MLRYEQLRDYDQFMERIERWRRDGHTAAQIAEKLNADGFRTPKTRGDYTADLVQNILARHGLSRDKSARRRTRFARVVASRSRARTKSIDQQTPQLGGSRLGPRSQDAVARIVDSVRPTSENANGCAGCGIVLETRRQFLSRILDHSTAKSR